MPKPTFSIPNHRVTTAAMAAQSQHHSLEPPLQGRSSSIPFPRSHHAGSMEQPKRRDRPNRWSLDGWACSSPAQPSQPCHGCPQLKPGTWPRTQTHAPHSLTHSLTLSLCHRGRAHGQGQRQGPASRVTLPLLLACVMPEVSKVWPFRIRAPFCPPVCLPPSLLHVSCATQSSHSSLWVVG